MMGEDEAELDQPQPKLGPSLWSTVNYRLSFDIIKYLTIQTIHITTKVNLQKKMSCFFSSKD